MAAEAAADATAGKMKADDIIGGASAPSFFVCDDKIWEAIELRDTILVMWLFTSSGLRLAKAAVLMLAAPIFLFAQPASEVVVLSTLHQFHGTNQGYSFADLSAIIERIEPDILAVELTPVALKNRTEQKTKQEYPRSVFPLIDKHGYKAVPLEPAEPEYSRLVGLLTQSNKKMREKQPERLEAFSVYSKKLYEHLHETWKSPAAVNSPETDALFDVKHRFQNALFGESEREVWDGWNSHFLKQILSTAKLNPGKRILVLVGAEHAYWLRNRLKEAQDVRLIDVQRFLR